jgi:hypothetical protein
VQPVSGVGRSLYVLGAVSVGCLAARALRPTVTTTVTTGAAPSESDPAPWETVTREAWGSYTIALDQRSDRLEPKRLRIYEGDVVRYEVENANIEWKQQELTGAGAPELIVVDDPMGSCCSGIENVFTRDIELQHLLSIDPGRGEGLTEVRDLDGRGRPELVYDLENFVGLELVTHLSSRVVIGWDGTRYRDRSREFPQIARAEAAKYRALIEQDHPDEFGNVANYYYNALLVGDAVTAKRFIANVMPSDDDGPPSWFARNAPLIEAAVTGEVDVSHLP